MVKNSDTISINDCVKKCDEYIKHYMFDEDILNESIFVDEVFMDDDSEGVIMPLNQAHMYINDSATVGPRCNESRLVMVSKEDDVRCAQKTDNDKFYGKNLHNNSKSLEYNDSSNGESNREIVNQVHISTVQAVKCSGTVVNDKACEANLDNSLRVGYYGIEDVENVQSNKFGFQPLGKCECYQGPANNIGPQQLWGKDIEISENLHNLKSWLNRALM
jgi:hypothetical protein